MGSLKNEIDRMMRVKNIRSYRVSPYWVSARNRQIDGIWIPYAFPGIKTNKKYGYSYHIHPHVSLTIFSDCFEIAFLIFPIAEKYGSKYQSRFLTFFYKEQNELRGYLRRLTAELPNIPLVFNILNHNKSDIQLTNGSFDRDYEKALRSIDGGLLGKEIVEIGYKFSRQYVIGLKKGIVGKATSIISKLSYFIAKTESYKPDNKEFLKSMFSLTRQNKTKQRLKKHRKRITKREQNFIEKIIPKLENRYNLSILFKEYEFATGDRADLVLVDGVNKKPAVAEVELNVGKNNKIGLLQVLKYKSLMAGHLNEPINEIKAYLIAMKIDKSIKGLCEKYNIRCIEIG